jgi:hypothetical protein
MTTVTAEAVAEHPAVNLSEPKEPHFFSVNYAKGDTWYRSCYASPRDHVLLDASTSYAAAPVHDGQRTGGNPRFGVPGRMRCHAPDARIVYLVRDPVKRTYSAYWHNVRSGIERRPFLHAVRENDWYLDLSRYGFQISEFYEIFPPEQILVLNVESRSLTQLAEAIWSFVGLSPPRAPVVAARVRNPSYRYTGIGRRLTALPFARRGLKVVRARTKHITPDWAHRAMGRLLTSPIPAMTGPERATVRAELADDVQWFKALTDIDFTAADGQ